MAADRDDLVYVAHMRDACRKSLAYAARFYRTGLLADDTIQDATARQPRGTGRGSESGRRPTSCRCAGARPQMVGPDRPKAHRGVDPLGPGAGELVEGAGHGLVVRGLRGDGASQEKLHIAGPEEQRQAVEGAPVVDDGHDHGMKAPTGTEAALLEVPLEGLVDGLDEPHALEHLAHEDADSHFVGVGASCLALSTCQVDA